MKRPSDLLPIVLALCLAASAFGGTLGPSAAASGDGAPNLFSTVPAGDPTYGQLQKLEKWGYLPVGSSESSLTRYQVADLILRAHRTYDEKGLIHLAQADLDLSAPETTVVHQDKSQTAVGETPAAGAATETGAAPAAATEAEGNAGPTEEEVAQTFTSLQQAYQWELDRVKGEVQKLKDRVNKLNGQNYSLWKSIDALTNSPSISLHGFGRARGLSERFFGDVLYPSTSTTGMEFLDLVPTGTISKEVGWSGILRLMSNMTSDQSASTLNLKRATIHLDPDFASVTMGDFDLSWTPFTLWNRDSLDRMYVPGILDRFNQYAKYPVFMNNAPDWPLRGLKLGTHVLWPDSSVLDSFKVETFAHMLQSGYNAGYLADRYTGWVFGAMAEIKAKKYLSLTGYGMMFDEPLNTDDPAAVYQQYVASTWAQQYRVGSLKPKVDFPLGQDTSVGVDGEGAGSIYWDDKTVAARKVDDWSLWYGPFLKYRESVATVRYLNVGYGFYSPLAQAREYDDMSGAILTHPITLTSDTGLDALGRPTDLFKYYNRLDDNVFPYGMATPNRKGFGLDMDFKALDKDALKIKAMAYGVQEITNNFVVNQAGTGFATVDGTTTVVAPMRKFVYVNVGPKLDIAALTGLTTRMDLGFNFRTESTKSDIGTLNSQKFDVGFGIGAYKWLEFELAGGMSAARGQEAFYNGLPYARTAYPYDNVDLGKYSVGEANQKTQYGAFSILFKIDRHSLLVMDMMIQNQTAVVDDGTKQKDQTVDLTYEITF